MKTIAATIALLLLSIGSPVFAQSTVSAGVNVNASVSARITTGKSHGDQEIERRITALTALNTKVQAMSKVSAIVKTNISNEVTTEIANLTNLKAKIDADTDITSLRTDIKSVTSSYRIFALVIPQSRIIIAADKLDQVGSAMTTFSAKLQSRISAAQAAGHDTSSLSSALTDMNAKIADANTQTAAAVSATASLTPDMGDKTKMAANDQALKDARAKLVLARQDLQAARKDIATIISGLKGFNAGASASSSVSTQ